MKVIVIFTLLLLTVQNVVSYAAGNELLQESGSVDTLPEVIV